MPKAAVTGTGAGASAFGTTATAGLNPAVYSGSVPVTVVFTPHQNPDHTAVKDTRT